jgi:PAS domain S-box-containing protein
VIGTPAPDFSSRAGDALWRALVDSVPYYVALVSLEGRLIYLNRGSESHPPSAVTGMSVVELLRDAAPRIEEAMARSAAGTTEELELPLRLAGKTRRIHVLMNAIRATDGEPLGILVVGHDVTESRQTEIELRMSVNALHRLVEARERLAADLHDGILQSLYGIGLRLEAARAALPAAGPAVEQHLERAIAQVRASMAEIRQFIRDERETGSLSVRWEDTLAGVLRGLEVSGGPRLSLEVPAEIAARVSERLRNELVFIAREAVSNAMRHSGGRRVTVRLTAEGPNVRLEIEDDGHGFTPGERTDGFGLLTMTRRAGQIGAILTVTTGPDTGTVVRLEIPVSGGEP